MFLQKYILNITPTIGGIQMPAFQLRSGIVIFNEVIDQLLTHSPLDEVRNLILEDFERAEEGIRTISFFESRLISNMLARAEEDLGLDASGEENLCRRILETVFRHRGAVHDQVLYFVEIRMTRVPNAMMDVAGLEDWINQILAREDLATAGWRLEKRRDDTPVIEWEIRNEAARQEERREMEQSSLRFAEMLRQPFDN